MAKLMALLVLLGSLSGQETLRTSTSTFQLDSIQGLELINGKAEVTAYQGRRAVRLVSLPGHESPDDSVLAIVSGTDFKNGTIEVDVAGFPRAGAPAGSRGFIGVVFRAQEHGARAENIYLRPTNGRAEDQLRRNHSVQYESLPDFPWHRLRRQSPGVYESYVDLEPGAWTRMKIVVSGTKARLYINGGDQPCLIVNDLKLGETHGQIALWSPWSTDAYFSNLTIKGD